jgi:hypothetical protein
MVLVALSAALLEVLVVLVAEDKAMVPPLQVGLEIHHQPVQARGIVAAMDIHQHPHRRFLVVVVEVLQR